MVMNLLALVLLFVCFPMYNTGEIDGVSCDLLLAEHERQFVLSKSPEHQSLVSGLLARLYDSYNSTQGLLVSMQERPYDLFAAANTSMHYSVTRASRAASVLRYDLPTCTARLNRCPVGWIFTRSMLRRHQASPAFSIDCGCNWGGPNLAKGHPSFQNRVCPTDSMAAPLSRSGAYSMIEAGLDECLNKRHGKWPPPSCMSRNLASAMQEQGVLYYAARKAASKRQQLRGERKEEVACFSSAAVRFQINQVAIDTAAEGPSHGIESIVYAECSADPSWAYTGGYAGALRLAVEARRQYAQTRGFSFSELGPSRPAQAVRAGLALDAIDRPLWIVAATSHGDAPAPPILYLRTCDCDYAVDGRTCSSDLARKVRADEAIVAPTTAQLQLEGARLLERCGLGIAGGDSRGDRGPDSRPAL